ncbi:HEPN domain-containing protein [Pseudomonas jessenii]|uniref:ApeA N-terminal domain 1-containing protein n=1 Tax=Pseudomonas jessenii TaxID=77298 RepID=UPI0030C4DADD
MTKSATEKMFCYFTLDGNQILGELLLAGEETKLNLSSRKQIPYNPEPHSLFGESIDHRKISLYDCVGQSPFPEGVHPLPVFKRETFPHYALIGSKHFSWNESVFKTVTFKTDDLGLLYSQRGSIGSALVDSEKLKEILGKTPAAKNLDPGNPTAIYYFAENTPPSPVSLKIGVFSIKTNFTTNTSDITGISCTKETSATLTYETPKTLDKIINDVTDILDFFTVIIGRSQGIQDLYANTSLDAISAQSDATLVHWSLAPTAVGSSVQSRWDMPVIPDKSEEAFSNVFHNWIHRHDEWCIARSRILHSQRNGTYYDENRLIAAANAFDLLPDSSYPEIGKLTEETSLKKERCKEIIMEMKHGDERSQILGTLNFWGSKLRDKILCKSKVVQENFNNHFQDLDDVLKIALKSRNFYVHGSDYGHKFYQELTTFLTDTLEFVFIAADLIECGWDASQWVKQGHGMGHPLARYLHLYPSEIIRFNTAKALASTSNK